MPVASLGKFLLDDIADQKDFASAQEGGDDKGSEGRNEYHVNATDNAGKAQRQQDSGYDLEIAGAQVLGRVDDAVVNFNQDIVDRKHHERKEVIHHAENNSGRGIDDG